MNMRHPRLHPLARRRARYDVAVHRSLATFALFFSLLPDARAEWLPFAWSVSPGWRTETIPFPLPFAPELPHRGLVELRFSPGMFKADSEELWTYSFVWWLEGP